MGMKVEEFTSPKATPKATITYFRKPITRSTSSKKTKELVTLEQKGKDMAWWGLTQV